MIDAVLYGQAMIKWYPSEPQQPKDGDAYMDDNFTVKIYDGTNWNELSYDESDWGEYFDPLYMVDGHPPKKKTISQIILEDPTYNLDIDGEDSVKLSFTELKAWYLVEFPQASIDDFDQVVFKLEEARSVQLGNGFSIQKISNSLPPLPTEDTGCKHEHTFINHAGGVKFKQCSNCKADLGDI